MATRAARNGAEAAEVPELPAEGLKSISIGAARLLGDPMVNIFLSQYKEMSLSTAIMSDTPEARERGRQAWLALEALTTDLMRFARGQITPEEHQALNAAAERLGVQAH